MALNTVVGDPAADSYMSEIEADSYFANDRLYSTAWDALSASQRETALRWAAREMQAIGYVGSRTNSDQSLAWPRSGVVVDGIELDSDAIPQAIKWAQAEFALWLSENDPAASSDADEFEEAKLGPIAVKFRDDGSTGSGSVMDAIPATVKSQLTGLLSGPIGTGGGFYKVQRV